MRSNKRAIAHVKKSLKVIGYLGLMTRLFVIAFLVLAAVAVDAYAFKGRYRDAAWDQGQSFGRDVQYRAKRIVSF